MKTRNVMKIAGILLTLIMMVSLIGVFTLTANAATGAVSYIDADGTEKTQASVEQWTDSEMDSVTLTSGWHTFTQSVKIGIMNISGDVHLILADGVTVEAKNGVSVPAGNSITIYGQKNQTGILLANTLKAQNRSGIGGGYEREGGTITINGGNITAYGGSQAGGIGGGVRATGNGSGDITINGGTVTAIAGSSGVGIGPGEVEVSTCKITINGGVVNAKGGESASGIGAGFNGGVGPITINGGTVTASGGTGIGGGSNDSQNVGKITINGGHVTAKGGEGIYVNGRGNDGAGIGGGYSDAVKEIEINGGYVVATSKNAAGIGGGVAGSGGTVTINGGTVIATGGDRAAGIGGGGMNVMGGDNPSDVIITGGNVIASGPRAAIGVGATVKDANGNSLSLVTYTINGVSDGTPVTELVGIDYDENGIVVVNGKINLYLPAGSKVATRIYVGNGTEFCLPESEGSTTFKLHDVHTVAPVYTAHATDTEQHVATYSCCGTVAAEKHSFDSANNCACGVSATATVNGVYYASFDTAFDKANATSGSTLKLVSDVTVSDVNVVGTFTLDLNGFTLKSTDNFAYALYINGGNLTITDTSADQDGAIIKNARNYDDVGVSNGALTVNAGNFGTVKHGDSITINGGTFEYLDVVRGTLVLRGGEFKTIWRNGATLEDTLAEDYYIYDENGNLLDTRQKYRLENVSVKKGADLSHAEVTLEYNNIVYTAQENQPTVVMTINGRTVKSSNYSVSYSNNTLVGTATVTATGNGSYTGSISTDFEITKGTLKVNAAPQTMVAFGDTHVGKPIVGGKVVIVGNESETVSGSWTWVDGTAKATFTPDAEYAGLFETLTDEVDVTIVLTAYAPVLTLTSPSPSIMPGMTIRMNVLAENAFDANVTELPTSFKVTYRIGENGTPTTVNGLEFTVPSSVTLGEEIYVTVENVAVTNRYTVATSNTVKILVGQVDYNEDIDELFALIETLETQINANDTDIDDILDTLDNVNTRLDNLDVLANTLTDKDTELEGKIADAIAKAEDELADAVATLEQKLNDAVADLQSQITANDTDIETLNGHVTRIDGLIEALKAVDETLVAKDTELEGKIADAIAKAEDELADAIKDLEEKLTGALEDAEAELKAAIESGDKALDEKIVALSNTLNETRRALEIADITIRTGLENKLAEAVETLNEAIATVQKNLDDAKAELEAAMKQGDADLSEEIAKLNSAMTDAKAALEKADADNKAELNAKLEESASALDAAIKAVQKNLDDAKAALEKSIADGNSDLGSKIADLNTALGNAISAYKAADDALKSDISTELQSATATLDAAINAVSKKLDDARADLEAKDLVLEAKHLELDEKDSELNTFIVIVCVIAGVSLAGTTTFVIWFFVDRKKRI